MYVLQVHVRSICRSDSSSQGHFPRTGTSSKQTQNLFANRAKDLPSTEMCEEYIPAAYTMTKSATWTYEKDMCSDPNQYYISFEETQSGYRDATLVDDCVAPCISSTDD